MRNLTIKVEEDVARWAKIYAAEKNTSVSRMLGEFLAEMKEQREGYQAAMKRFLAQEPFLMSKPGEKYPTREEIHERHPLR